MELVSYAMDFVSYLMQNLSEKHISRISSIILFGSAARGEAGKDSDVDIFIDSKDEKLEKNIEKITRNFYDSIKFRKYWNLLGIKNDIHIIAGQLDEWKLKDSMLGSSVVLYEKYSPKLKEGRNRIILSWGNIKPNSKRVMMNKKLSGYNYYGKRYSGLLEKYNGSKLGANVIIVNAEDIKLFLDVFRSFKAAVKIQRVFEYNQ